MAKQQNVFVDLSGVTMITSDAIAGLLATINHREIGLAYISGNAPTDQKARAILNQSGFRDYVNNTARGLYRTPMGKIQKRRSSRDIFQSRYDQFVARDLIQFATEKLTGAQQPHGPSFSIFGEAMLNTFNHASGGSDPEPWWATVYFDAERRRACFTFIDQGVGVFQSHGWTTRLRSWGRLALLDHPELLRRLFQGEVPSPTGIPGRGNGIPGMYGHCKAHRIHVFTLVSNDVIGEAETGNYRSLPTSFQGTILYWEISHDDPKS